MNIKRFSNFQNNKKLNIFKQDEKDESFINKMRGSGDNRTLSERMKQSEDNVAAKENWNIVYSDKDKKEELNRLFPTDLKIKKLAEKLAENYGVAPEDVLDYLNEDNDE